MPTDINGQIFPFDNREPARIAQRLDSETRKSNHVFKRNQLLRRKTDLELQLRDLVDRHDELVVMAASAKAHLSTAKKSDEDYDSLKNGLKVAQGKTAELKAAIVEKQGQVDAVQAEIDENLDELKLAIESELKTAGRAEVRQILQGSCNDAMALCGELKAKLEGYSKYGEGVVDGALTEIDGLHEAVEAIWQRCQKI